MVEAFSQMIWPLLACFVLVGIHSYLGIHVIARKVIFVDLALAQIAALGAVYGVFIGLSFELDTLAIKAVSVIFTLFGALVFSFTRTPNERIPHEAIIGVIYAAALSMTLLVTANLPHGADEVRQMLAGSILWVTPREVGYTALLYSVVGAVHVVFHKQFFRLSEEEALLKEKDLNIKLWDFLFYATFGVVVTSSVGIGGVLLVFGYLVIPSVIAIMLATSTKARLIIAWSSGLIASFWGVVISYYFDLPSGPTIVVLLGLALVVLTLAQEIKVRTTRRRGFVHSIFVLSVMLVAVLTPTAYQSSTDKQIEGKHARAHALSHDAGGEEQIAQLKTALASADDDEIINALDIIREKKLGELLPEVLPFLTTSNDKAREIAVSIVKLLGDKQALAPVKNALNKEKDVFIKIALAQTLLSLGDREGINVLNDIHLNSDSQFAKEDALAHLREWLEGAPADDNELSKWIQANKNSLRFDERRKIVSLVQP